MLDGHIKFPDASGVVPMRIFLLKVFCTIKALRGEVSFSIRTSGTNHAE